MIKIHYFASLREQVGRANDQLDIQKPITALEAWQQATSQKEFPESLLIAVNQEYTTADAIVNDGDELAFFPPVTGG